MTRQSKWLLAAACVMANAAGASAAHAQSGVTVYGVLDQYLNYLHSSSGTTVKSMEDGAYLRSRIGFRGVEDLGGGVQAKFALEGGFSVDNGVQGDSTRFFDRQSWVGLAGSYGEFRLGRMNSPAFVRGCNIDFGCRSLGSIVNTFGLPIRYDNELGYISPRMGGVLFEGQLSLPETASGNRPYVYQVGVDWKNDSFAVGYAGMRGRPPANAVVSKDVVYDNAFFNWMYGKGTVYLVYVRSNNNTASAGLNNGGAILSPTGGYNLGTNTDLNRFYKVYQISADYRISESLRVGAIWGRIDDTSGRQRGANGGSLGAFYDLSKRTTLMALVDTLRNDTNGGWRPTGSGSIKSNFTAAGDVNGRTINGVQAGIIHKF